MVLSRNNNKFRSSLYFIYLHTRTHTHGADHSNAKYESFQ